MNYCFPKSGDASKPPIPYRVYAAVQAVFSKRVLLVLAVILALISVLSGYYLYLDRLYIVDEVLQGNKLREYALKEKVTIRVVAPRRNEDLSKFVLEHSICQAVQEIQIIWPHQHARPLDSYFKYPHTHSKVTFIEATGSSAWETLYGPAKYSTEGVLLLDADVVVPCNSLAFAQTVWRSSQDALVGFFPRLLDWSAGTPKKVSLLGWNAIAHQRAYSLMLPAGLLLRKEYLENMAETKISIDADTAVPATRQRLRDYVNDHPHCADLALPLYITYLTSRKPDIEAEPVDAFPVSRPQPPIFVDAPGLSIRSGVELSRYPNKDGSSPLSAVNAERGGESNEGATEAKVVLSEAQTSACLTEIVALLSLSPVHFPAANFKSTVASTHWIWMHLTHLWDRWNY